MQKSAFRRLHANFGHFSLLSKRFTDTVSPASTSNTNKPPGDASTSERVLFKEHSPHVLEVVLNNPKKLNSVDLKMIKTLLRKVRHWVPETIDTTDDERPKDAKHKPIDNEDIPKVLLMTGAGEKAFCAGGDIVTLYNSYKSGENPKALKDFFRYEYLLDYSLTRMKPIQVSIWNGYVMGGGVGLSINSPIRIATDKSVFSMPETAIGLFPDVGATYFLPRIFNKDQSVGLYMGLTGDKVKGKDLAKCGVATHYVPSNQIEKLKDDIVKGANNDTTVDDVKNIVSKYAEETFSSHDFSFPHYEQIKRAFLLDSLKDIETRLLTIAETGSESEQTWAKNTLRTLEKMSPISVSVFFEQMKVGKDLKSIEEAFNLEAQLVASFLEDSDFFEGVRALLVSKDNAPKWKHKSFSEVNHDEIVKKYFERHEEIDVDPNKDEIEEKDEKTDKSK